MPSDQKIRFLVQEMDDDEIQPKTDNTKLLKNMSIGFAEYIGTAILIFATCMGCTLEPKGGNLSTFQPALTSGLAVMAVIQIFGHISGAFVNPAVTLCAVLMGEISSTTALIYVISQIAGSFTGYALLMAVAPERYLDGGASSTGFCVTTYTSDISFVQAATVEALSTSIMCFAICSSWDPRNSQRTDSVPLKIGLIVFLLGVAGRSYTGGCMNPVRSLAPAVMNAALDQHLVYWLGPFIGATFAGLCYRNIFLEKKSVTNNT